MFIHIIDEELGEVKWLAQSYTARKLCQDSNPESESRAVDLSHEIAPGQDSSPSLKPITTAEMHCQVLHLCKDIAPTKMEMTWKA